MDGYKALDELAELGPEDIDFSEWLDKINEALDAIASSLLQEPYGPADPDSLD